MPLRTSAVAPVSPFSDTRERDGQWLLIAGGVLLGSIGVFVEEAAQHPLVTVWFRCALGTLALLAWCLAAGRGRELWLSGRARWVACATGVLMVRSYGETKSDAFLMAGHFTWNGRLARLSFRTGLSALRDEDLAEVLAAFLELHPTETPS